MNTKSILLPLACAGLGALASSAMADVTITTEGSMAPNAYGSASFATWADNALYAAENGLTTYGAPGPGQFSVTASPLPYTENFVTGFNSWEGQADPAAPYNNEYGTRASFVGIINGNGALINMNNFGVTLSSSDPGDNLGVSWPNNSILPGDWTYDQYDIGIVFNNGVNINNGFSVIDSGDPGQEVNEIISVGAGNAYAGYLGDDPNPGANDQDIINYDLAGVPNGYDFTGAFSYGADTGSATIDFQSVPDAASTLSLLGLGCGALAAMRRGGKRA